MLSRALHKKIIQFLNGHTSSKNWMLHETVIHAREGRIYRFSSLDSAHDVAAKVFHQVSTNSPTPTNAQPLFNTLKRFDDSLNSLELPYRIPTPIQCFPEDHCFLMQWAEGKPLEEQLWRYFYRKNHQQNNMKSAFSWLKHYHAVANPQTKAVNISYFTDQLDRAIQQHKGDELIRSNPIFAEGLEAFKQQSKLFENLHVPYADNHGDFTPSNVIINDDQITAIDIGGGQNLPVAVDMALMLNYLSIEYFFMLTKGDMKQAPPQWPLLSLVLDAYEYPTEHTQRHFFLYVFHYQMLRRWLVINNRDTNKQRSAFVEKRRKKKSEIIVKGLSQALLAF